MKKLLVANYKMNGDKNFYQKVNKVFNKLKSEDTIILCPPFVYMPLLKIKNKSVCIGAQDVSNNDNKKSTGQISAKMLKDFGVQYCIIGHSERRAIGETDSIVAEKVFNAQKEDIVPIICVGEESFGEDLGVLTSQVEIALSKAENKEIIFAYEPVWAIGTGEQPTVTNIKKALKFIKITAKHCGHSVKVLYGGSVNASNYKEIKKSGVDGYLMGGVSLKLDEFVKIVKGE